MQLFLNYLTASANRACAAVAVTAAFATILGGTTNGCSVITDAAATHTSAGAATTLALVKTFSNGFNERFEHYKI